VTAHELEVPLYLGRPSSRWGSSVHVSTFAFGGRVRALCGRSVTTVGEPFILTHLESQRLCVVCAKAVRVMQEAQRA
jgi:hypothetical protein